MLLPAAVRSGVAELKQEVLFVAAGAAGVRFTVTVVAEAGPAHPVLVAVTE